MKKIAFLLLLLILISCKKEEKKINHPPEIISAKIEPEDIMKNMRAGVFIKANDKDKDDITYKIEWFLNDEKVFEGKEISLEKFKKGDLLYAIITPYDGKEYGKPYKTAPALIKNSQPKIIEAKFSPDTIFTTTEKIEIVAKAEDPDNDELSYIVEWYINGKMQEEKRTVFNPPKLKENDLLEAIVYAYDGEEKSKSFSRISYLVQNSPPFIDVPQEELKIPSYPEFTYKINAYDPDGDKLKFEIISSNIKEIQIDENGIIKGKIEENVKKINIKIKVIDTKGNYKEKEIIFSL
ncbi:MAG: hypothetical protein ABIM62_06560 [candidate division WOR-3 bacterium]